MSNYDKLHNYYDLIFEFLLGFGHRLAIKALHFEPGFKVLEVGTGTGLTLPLYPKTVDVHGVDLSANMLKQAQIRLHKEGLKNVTLHQMNAETLGFPDNTFDRINAPSIFSVLPHPEIAMEELIRVCKPGGYICIVSHFEGESRATRAIDVVFGPVVKPLFNTDMKRDFVEKNPRVTVLLKKSVLPLNFSTLYLLQKN